MATTSTATARTGSPESHHAAKARATVNGKEHQRIAVREPRHGRLRLLRRLDQPDNAGIGAVLGLARGFEVKGFAGIG